MSLLSILALVPAALMPLAVLSQTAPDAGSAPAEKAAPNYKYEAFAGYAYTSLNQVNQSRYGLQGVNLSVTRDLGEYFGVLAEGAYYKYATGTSNSTTNTGNPGDPSVSTVLFGPVARFPVYGKFSGNIDLLLGGEHTGGENQTPKVSFAYGFGGGLEYKLNSRFSIRTSGERIHDSFSLTGNSAALGFSPNPHWNARAAVGVVFHF
jgi:hypothetical protein